MSEIKINPRAAIDTLFLVVLLILFSLQKPGTIFLAYILPLVYLLGTIENYRVKKSRFIIICLVILLCLPAAMSMNHNVTPLFYLLLSPFLCLAAYKIGSNPLPHVKGVISKSYWFFFSAIVLGAAFHWDAVEPIGEIIPGASQNGLPSYLIVLLVAYLITAYSENSKLPISPSVATLVVAVIGQGRAGIIVAFSILCFSILVNFLSFAIKKKRPIFLFFAPLSVALFAIVFSAHIGSTYNEIFKRHKA